MPFVYTRFLHYFSAKWWVFLLLFSLAGCSTKKNTFVNRNYHNMTTRFNVYFNAKEKFKEGLEKVEDSYEEDYKKILPLFVYGDEAASKSIYPEMEVVIEKCSKAIDRHSMEFRGKEVNRWIDDSYFLMGKAYFYKQEFGPAKEMFEFTAKQYKDSDTRWDALIWLVRSHIETDDFKEALKIIRLIENSNEFPPDRYTEFRQVYADYFIQQENYEMAIPELKYALELTKKKKERTRMTFILAQLYQEENESFLANSLYKKVIKMNPPYEMAFYAKINMAMAFSSEDGGALAIRQTLEEMLKDEKNKEYFDQIYYALGELSLKQGDRDEAIELFKTSASVSVENTNQKGLSFLKVAEIYLREKEYETSQRYYDSTATYISPEHPDYEEIIKLRTSLTELVKNLNVIALEDSLQRLAGMSEEELQAFVETKIEQAVEEEERKKEEKYYEEQQRQQALMNQNQNQNANPFAASGDNSWYFYNPSALSFGYSEFVKLWGKRKNEDNWRRSTKSSGGFDAPPGIDMGELSGLDMAGPASAQELKDPNFYTKNIPNTPEKINASNQRIQQAYYNLGGVYKEMMEDNPKAIESFEALVTRYDSSKLHPAAYYQLYILGQKEGDISLQNKYKNKLLAEYPYSDYAKLIKNPNFLEEQNQMSEEVIAYYKQTLTYFESGYYRQVLASCNESEIKYPDNHLASKFKFLKAVCTGKVENKESLIKELEDLQTKYPGTEEAKEAKEIIDLLLNPPKIEEAQEEKPKANFEKYKIAPESNHTVIIIIPEKDLSASKAKIAITDFNRKYFKTTPLSVSSVFLNDDEQMISVKLFKDEAKAMDYYKTFIQNTEELKDINGKEYPIMVISYENYPTFYKDKNVAEYMAFFEAVFIRGETPKGEEEK